MICYVSVYSKQVAGGVELLRSIFSSVHFVSGKLMRPLLQLLINYIQFKAS